MQREIKLAGDLLNENGELVEAGYAKSLIKRYDRSKIKANSLRIKEWDYYLVYNEDYGVALTIDDNSYMGLNSVTFLDFKNKTEVTKSPMKFMTKGKTNFPSTSKVGNVESKSKNYSFQFLNDGKTRKLLVYLKNFKDGKDINVSLELTDEPEDSMVIVTPFKENKKAFYYNQKIVGFKTCGMVSIGDKKYNFEKSNTRAILDWGRGVWTYKNTWFWGAGAGTIDGREFGFNFGYGFGDTSSATENMIFVDGIAQKLENVHFDIPMKNGKEDYLNKWRIVSDDGRVNLKFSPIIDRHANSDILIISSNQHQVFGLLDGTIRLENGEMLALKNYLAFFEKVVNKW